VRLWFVADAMTCLSSPNAFSTHPDKDFVDGQTLLNELFIRLSTMVNSQTQRPDGIESGTIG
jgi:hypothetical protein